MAEASKVALAFFAKKDYINAASKYSDAIAEEPNNAILYANRAACYSAMQRLIHTLIHSINIPLIILC
jgi:Tfp pilus assembly protein PilF